MNQLFEVIQSDNDDEFLASSSSEVEEPERDQVISQPLFTAAPSDRKKTKKKRKRGSVASKDGYLFSGSSEGESGNENSSENEPSSTPAPERISIRNISSSKKRKPAKRQKQREEVQQHIPSIQEEPQAHLGGEYDYEEVENGARDEKWIAEKNPEEREEEQETHFKPTILPSRKRLEALLMPGEDPYGPCFACTYQENSQVGVIGKHWNTMSKMLHEMIARMPPEDMFLEIHRFFVDSVMTPFIKSNCHDDQMRQQFEQTPLEYIWSPYKVAQHYTQHTVDPLLTTMFDLWDLKAVKEVIKSDMLAKKHDLSERLVIDAKALDMLFKVQREEKALYSRNPEKMLAANSDARLPEKYAHIHYNRVSVVPYRSKRPYPDQFTITP